MARRIRWQIVIAVLSALLVVGLLSRLALLRTAVSQPLAGGIYVEAALGAPVHILPLLNDPQADPIGRDLIALMFDGLIRTGIDGLPEGALALRWNIDQRGEVYTFDLRRDVTWHDGEPFDADDVIFTLQTIQNSAADSVEGQLWQQVLIDRIDAYTVRFTLDSPYAPFLEATRVPILPAHLLGNIPLEEWADTTFATAPVGTGPYRLVTYTNEYALLENNPTYLGQRPFIERIEVRFFESPQAALGALIRGEVQATGAVGVATDELNRVNVPSPLRRVYVPIDHYVVLSFNLRREPLDNLELRQALAHGLDKDRLIEQALPNNRVTRLDTPILPGWWAYNPTAAWYAADTTRAEQILEQLGYQRTSDGVHARDGVPLVLPLITDAEPGRVAAAQEIARQWSTLGVQVEREELDSDILRQRLHDHDFVLALHGWARLGHDPDVFALWDSSQAATGFNYSGLQDDTIDQALSDGRTQHTLADRIAAYTTFQQRWIELVPAITLYQPNYTFIANQELGGVRFDQPELINSKLLVDTADRYRNVPGWFVNSSREIRSILR